MLVYYRPEHPDWQYEGEVSEDGRYLVISIVVGTDARQRIVVRDLTEPYAMPLELIDNFEHEFTFLGSDGPRLFFKTDVDAPRRRVIAIDLRAPKKKDWQEIIPQAENTLTEVSLVGDRFIALYLKDASTEVKLFSLAGKFVQDVQLPGIGTAAGFTGKRHDGKRTDRETFYSFSSLATPPSIYRLDLATGESRLIRRAEAKFDPERYEVKRVFYKSKDGTRVPMFIAHRKGLKLDGSNPTLLYGYGGFNIAVPPMFSISRAAVDGDGRGLRPGEHPRRRRIWRGLAPGRHEAQEAERVRRLHRRRRVADRQQVHAVATSWPSRAAATAGCWSAR